MAALTEARGRLSKGELVVSGSLLDTFSTCKRMAWYRYVQGIIPKSFQFPFFTGEMGHLGLELYFRDWNMDKALGRVYEEINLRRKGLFMDAKTEDRFSKEAAVVMGSLTAYPKYYDKDQDNFKVIDTEIVFERFEVAPGIFIKGKVDLLARNEFGRLFIGEHKFMSMLSDAYVQSLPLAWQSILYPLAMEGMFGQRVSYITYDMVRKSALRLKKT